ncbi:hypothetical protein ALC53_00063, partial [Atta colombica]
NTNYDAKHYYSKEQAIPAGMISPIISLLQKIFEILFTLDYCSKSSTDSFNVFCLQDTLYSTMPFRLSPFKVIRKNSESSGQRGICILLRNNNIIFNRLDLSNYSSVEIQGDFNAHHSSWGCSKFDRPGKALLSMVDVNGACIMEEYFADHLRSLTKLLFPEKQ